MIILLTFILACLYLSARGGGYRYSEPNDTGTVLSRLIFSPMNWLRDNNYPYIRDQIFTGVILIPVVYLLAGLSWQVALLTALGWTLGEISGWGKTLLQMSDIKNFKASFIRCLQFGGLYLFPALITGIYIKAIILTVITAFLIPSIYFLCYKISGSDRSTNMAEFLTGALIGGLSLICHLK